MCPLPFEIYLQSKFEQNADRSRTMNQNLEEFACQPHSLAAESFNPHAQLPYGCTTQNIQQAMNDFWEFLVFINRQLPNK